MKCRWHLSTRGGIEEFILSGEILGNRGLDRLTHKQNYKTKLQNTKIIKIADIKDGQVMITNAYFNLGT